MSSWKLENVISRDGTMRKGEMDVVFEEGTVVPITEPEEILAQRVEKSSVERQGSNRFAPGWGSVFEALLGKKLVPAEVAREIGSSLRLMVASMVSEQNRVSRNVPLDPAETAIGLNSVRVGVVDDTIDVEAHIATGAGTSAVANAQVT